MTKLISILLLLSLSANIVLADCPCPPVKKPVARHATVKKAVVTPKRAAPAPAAASASAASSVTIVNVLPPMNPAVSSLIVRDTVVVKQGTSKKKVFGLLLLGAAAGFAIAKLTDNDDECTVSVGPPLVPTPSTCEKPSKKNSHKGHGHRGHGKGHDKGCK